MNDMNRYLNKQGEEMHHMYGNKVVKTKTWNTSRYDREPERSSPVPKMRRSRGFLKHPPPPALSVSPGHGILKSVEYTVIKRSEIGASSKMLPDTTPSKNLQTEDQLQFHDP